MSRLPAVLLVVAACGGGAAPQAAVPVAEAPAEAPAESPTGAPVPVAAADVPADPSAAPLPPATAELAVTAGSLGPQLQAQVARAKEQGLTPFVQIYANWCDSCRKLRAAMTDPRMVEAFRGTWIVRLDSSAWGAELQQGMWVREGFSVPAFYRLRDDGTLGAKLDGSAWGEDVVENMAPRIGDYFRANGAVAP